VDLSAILLWCHAAIVILIAITVRGQKTDAQFTIGNRSVSTLGLTTSIFSTLVTESIVFFSVSLAARYGTPHAFGPVIGLCGGLLALSLIADRIRDYGARHDAHTVVEYCMREWGPRLGVAAKFLLLALLFWNIILQINLNGQIISTVLGWPLPAATSWAVVLVLGYILWGGYPVVVKTDIFQSFVLALIVLVPFAVSRRPDITEMIVLKGTFRDMAGSSLLVVRGRPLPGIRPLLDVLRASSGSGDANRGFDDGVCQRLPSCAPSPFRRSVPYHSSRRDDVEPRFGGLCLQR
jgi:Na+/proline symporter